MISKGKSVCLPEVLKGSAITVARSATSQRIAEHQVAERTQAEAAATAGTQLPTSNATTATKEDITKATAQN